MNVDQATGEVREGAPAEDEMTVVPLHIAELDEADLLELFPTPVQAAGALIIARERIARAPKVLRDLSKELKARKRELTVVAAMARQEYRERGMSIFDAKEYATAHPDVIKAQEAVDEADLRLEYGREMKWALSKDVDILRSLNTNFRQEHSRG